MSDLATAPQLSLKAIELAKRVVRMTTAAGSGHPTSALSILHIVTVLLYRQMRHDPRDPWNPAADRLVLSEGHAVPVVYAAWADLGGVVGESPDSARPLTVDELDTLRAVDSVLDGHPNPQTAFPFFDLATGSLGQGLSGACGLALAARLDRLERRVYVLIGDGESREGQVAEALDFLVDNDLTRVVPVFNCNGLGQSDPVSQQQSAGRLALKAQAYGFEVERIDGHDVEQVIAALERAAAADSPRAIVAQTVKGWGVSAFQETNLHGKTLDEEAADSAIDELDGLEREVRVSAAAGAPVAAPVPSRPRREAVLPGRLGPPDFEALLADHKDLKKVRSGTFATRRAYGLALRELAKADPRVVALDGDVKNSTYSEFVAEAVPGRFFEARIAEQNMVSVAAGLAAGGKIPFAGSFAKFLVRGYDQLELALLSGVPLKLVGSHIGANIGADGPSQMGLTDVAYFGGLATVERPDGAPLVTLFQPACAVAAYHCVQMMADCPGAAYLRTMRPDLPFLYDPDETFEPGGSKLLRQGEDVALVASTYMVHVALRVAERLREDGIRAAVVDAYSLPLKDEPLRDVAAACRGRLLTLEDNYGNGLGAAVAGLVAEGVLGPCRLRQMHARTVPRSGRTSEDVLGEVGLSDDEIETAVRTAIS
jgi:transketolase